MIRINLAIITRVIKYFLNAGALYMMTMIALIKITFVYRYPDCDGIRIKISENIGELILIYIPFLALITALNLLLERKIEKRLKSKEYLLLFYISLLVLTAVITYTSYDFYTHCRK